MAGLARARRTRIRGGIWATLAVAGLLAATGAAAQDLRRHAMSLTGEPQFPAGFKNFSWVNPDAPKGGRVRRYASGSFDSLNQFPAQGEPAAGLNVIYDTLFSRDPNEAATGYALIAEWASYPPDFGSVTFGLRSEARFNDGKPVTVEDVIFSFEVLKKVSPLYSTYYQHVIKAEKVAAREVRFTFDVKGNHELPQITSEMPILPKHWWEAKQPSGEPRDISKSSLDVPLGSGPYRVKSFEAGRTIVYERVKDWWAANLPLAKGQYNFDEMEYTFYRDRIAPFEAFKRGDIDYWQETQAKNWATEYDFEAVKRGLAKKEAIAVKRVAPMQSFVMNLRKPIFQDVRVRRALVLAFDFEWANKNLFYGLNRKLGSYFDNSELASSGVPEGRELEILNEVKEGLPPEVFTSDYKATFNTAGSDPRRSLAAAAKLLAEAGYVSKGGVLNNAAGKPLEFEFLLDNPAYERIVLPYRDALAKLGVRMSVRTVDSTQYTRSHEKFEYDMTFDQFAQSESPGNEQRDFFGSSTINNRGGHNYAGIQNKAIDAIIEHIIFAKDRADLIAATHALDRALLWNFYVVPTWYRSDEWIAYWDMFGRPDTLPARSAAFSQTWWFDAGKAKALAAVRAK